MISLIAAIDKNRGIGNENKLLTYIPEDLKYFKSVTNGHTIVMGYNTYMSLPIRPLPNRKNIVLTTKNITLPGAIIINSLDKLIKEINLEEEVFICGGESIYKQLMPYADKLYITHIFDEYEADTFFPEITDDWEISESICKKENINHNPPYIWTVYTRKI